MKLIYNKYFLLLIIYKTASFLFNFNFFSSLIIFILVSVIILLIIIIIIIVIIIAALLSPLLSLSLLCVSSSFNLLFITNLLII